MRNPDKDQLRADYIHAMRANGMSFRQIAQGLPLAGVILVWDTLPVAKAIDDLLAILGASEAGEWENRIEPRWVHVKRGAYQPEGELTPPELQRRLCAHFETQPLLNSFDS